MTAIESKINDSEHIIPDNKIAIVTESDEYQASVFEIVESFKGMIKRDWFINHAYHCLPLVIGNQYGFAIKSLYDFTAEWNGCQAPQDLKVEVFNESSPFIGHQFISSHFGMGIITIQNRFHFRTPPGVNLMTINPPNMFTPGLCNMTGVVETDNLRRDFTFNLKVTTPNTKISVKKGDIISAFIPIQRYFVDKFDMVLANELFSDEVISAERDMGQKFGKERQFEDINKLNGNGRRYMNGEDADGNQFPDHQRRIQ
jgi:hypothetical protein